MKKIEIKGGLGNQMFQYAYGRSLEMRGQNVLFIRNFPYGGIRKFRLDVYKISTNSDFINKSTNYFNRKIEILCTYFKIKKTDEYYQSEDHFKDIENLIRKEFTPKEISPLTKSLENLIRSSKNPTAIHVRRGDYLNNKNIKLFHICDEKYYTDASNKIIEMTKELNTDFFFFTDDLDWIKEKLSHIKNATFISDKKLQEYEEIYLMSVCKNNIISNSTFAWWGAWLNQNNDKIVIGPKYWFKNIETDKTKILPKEWLKI